MKEIFEPIKMVDQKSTFALWLGITHYPDGSRYISFKMIPNE